MLAGELYLAGDPELVALRADCARLLDELNRTVDPSARTETLRRLFAAFGDESEIRSPFFCDYGSNISIGSGVFLNFNCVILDVVAVTIGDRTQVGPAVQMLAADHPIDRQGRRDMLESGRPVTIGEDVWIGGGAMFLPGVSVGAGSVIGAGSVVTRDIPAGVVAVGNPCRVIREL